MTKKKTGLLPKFEVLIIFVFFISFILWAMSKCNKTQEDLSEDTSETTSTTEDETVPDSLTATLPVQATTQENPSSTPATTANPPTTTPQPEYAPLYVTIEGLNMRAEPQLNSEVIMRLQLFEKVNFLGEVTDSTTEVNLGYEVANEPWVKVQHARGKVGWVYGAGVHYYKKKREGVLE